jgi:predicted NAD/FAD-binding protein
LTAAHCLAERHEVSLFERSDRFGGHAHSVAVPGLSTERFVDVGFMVFNDRTYPTFHRLLAKLGLADAVEFSEMSFGYWARTEDRGYALNFHRADFARTTPFARTLLPEILAFCRRAERDLEAGLADDISLSAYLRETGVSAALAESYVVPMGAAIWSTRASEILKFPAAYFLRFFDNHGFLATHDPPRWQCLRGGSRRYVQAIIDRLGADCARVSSPVSCVLRRESGPEVRLASGESFAFDQVVIATQADEALALLGDPSADEKTLLGAWRYHTNAAVLHTDTSFLPPDERAWASWNYLRTTSDDDFAVTYDLGRLQNIVDDQRYFLTLNPLGPVADGHTLATVEFRHPIYTREAVASQAGLRALNGQRATSFCGNYLGYGFHEDAVRAGLDVAQGLGGDL